MLKIGVIRWRGKCSRHPSFDPIEDGRGAIRGGCAKCSALVEIAECHQRMLELMRTFTPPAEKKARRELAMDDSQGCLF
ncbi:MAG TPA: hypothetical protein VHB50_21700 [Bryobacteraceae bacterium]|nr:hypothetical protein [Bryobacteraceae bacterium]